MIVGTQPKRVVGVVADLKDGPLEAPARPAMYVPFDQTGFALVVRTAQATQAIALAFAPAIHEVRPGLIVSPVGTMAERIDRLPSAYLHRSSAWLVGGFAALAFLLSVVGLYGVVAYSVSQRTREIGIRLALGASSGAILRWVFKQGMKLALLGTVVGLVGAFALTRLLRGLLFGVSSADPLTYAGLAALLAAVALLACYIPARRATRVDPMVALRHE
jgi:cell division protein FtsX